MSKQRTKSNGSQKKVPKPGMTPDTRKDNLDQRKGPKEYPNDANWYYGDLVMGDEISRFSFNQFVGLTDIHLRYNDEMPLPSVMVIPLNPCPGVTPADVNNYLPELNSAKGFNAALQQWWSVLTSRSGRGATYSKVDVGMLLEAIGEMISMTEHLRRILGVAFTYNLRNRVIPAGLIQAMGVDSDDLLSNLADYRLRLNTLILRLNKIPIPGNIEYFRKCQDLYQKIYADSVSDMAQLYAFVPATTWTIDESSSPLGTQLKTTNAFFTVDKTLSGEASLKFNFRTFNDYCNDLEGMISALTNSSTFSNLYSDMLNAASMGNISLWSFDLVPEQYAVVPEYNPMMLLMIHNLYPTGNMDVKYDDLCTYINDTTHTTYATRFDHGTPLNDVFCDPDLDILVHNPQFRAVNSTDTKIYAAPPMLLDMLEPNPDVNTRIEVGVYKWGVYDINNLFHMDTGYSISGTKNILDLALPDHYVVDIFIFTDTNCDYSTGNSGQLKCQNFAGVNGPRSLNYDVQLAGYMLSKFQWAPISFMGAITIDGVTEMFDPLGELNYYTILDNEWFLHVNDAKYFGLFAIK